MSLGVHGGAWQSAGPWTDTTGSEADEELTNWCNENGVKHLGSCFQREKRGTWYNNLNNQKKELDHMFTMQADMKHIKGCKVLPQCCTSCSV